MSTITTTFFIVRALLHTAQLSIHIQVLIFCVASLECGQNETRRPTPSVRPSDYSVVCQERPDVRYSLRFRI